MTFDEYSIEKRGAKKSRKNSINKSYISKKICRSSKIGSAIKSVGVLKSSRIVRAVMHELINNLLNGCVIDIPHIGDFCLLKKRNKFIEKDGKLKPTNKVNWNETLKLWYADKDCEMKKIYVYNKNKDYYFICYKRRKNKYLRKYSFRMSRTIKLKINECLKENTLIAYE